jgi:hypothetical protein
MKLETLNDIRFTFHKLGRGILPYVADDPVNHKSLLFAFDTDLSDSIEHEAVSEIALRALVDQNPA